MRKLRLNGPYYSLDRLMDEIHFFIISNLMKNSRVTYRELADMTDMLVSGIHKRMYKFIENGEIRAFIAMPSMIALKYLMVIIFGISTANSIEAVMDKTSNGVEQTNQLLSPNDTTNIASTPVTISTGYEIVEEPSYYAYWNESLYIVNDTSSFLRQTSNLSVLFGVYTMMEVRFAPITIS